MILESLVRYYEALAAKGESPRDGWAQVRVSWMLELNGSGEVLAVNALSEPKEQKGKTVEVPRTMLLPAPFKRSSGILPDFLCDNPAYILGLAKSDAEKDVKRAPECFAASRDYHLSVLEGHTSPAARAVCAFFRSWKPEEAADHPAVGGVRDELAKSGGNVTFFVKDRFAAEDPDIAAAWQEAYGGKDEEKGETAVCLVTGKRAVPEKVHPAVKGVRGAQSSGAAIVSFNADSFTSFGKEQSLNAPVGKYAAFAYTTALNRLLADPAHRQFIGDATVVYWAEGAEPAYQDFMTFFLDGGNDEVTDADLDGILKRIARREAAVFRDFPLDPSNRFFILALSPNNARVSVRFFHDTSFGDLARNFERFYEELSIVGAPEHMPLWRLLGETVRKGADGKAVGDPSPQLSGDLLRAVLTGGDFPETFYRQILSRIYSERDVRAGKAAAVKAFLLRNRIHHPDYPKYKEVLGVKLNEETTYLPYVLGELFAVLEAVQETASGVTTIKDRFFTSACTTPALVFPRLIELANHHLRKLDGGSKVYYSRQLNELMSKITESYPAQMDLNDQGIFQIGYYHKRQKRFEPNPKNKEIREDTDHE